MKKIVSWLMPKDKLVFEMLSLQSESLLKAADELEKLLADYHDMDKGERKARVYAIKNISQKSEEARKRILGGLEHSKVFIDKVIVLLMADNLLDAIRTISTISSRFITLSIERIDENITKIASMVCAIAGELSKGFADLGKKKNMRQHSENLREHCGRAIELCQEAFSDLFHFYKNSIDIIKTKEIYDLFEKIAYGCRDLSDMIDLVASKHE